MFDEDCLDEYDEEEDNDIPDFDFEKEEQELIVKLEQDLD